MAAFSLFRKSSFLSNDEQGRVIAAIRAAEQRTSGEIRVFLERKCRFVDPLDRAAEIFWSLRMDHTGRKNAVLVYVAVRDHQYAIFADEGIHKALGSDFWNREVKAMQVHFRNLPVAEAVAHVIADLGHALEHPFPYQQVDDRNELPDDIVFGT